MADETIISVISEEVIKVSYSDGATTADIVQLIELYKKNSIKSGLTETLSAGEQTITFENPFPSGTIYDVIIEGRATNKIVHLPQATNLVAASFTVSVQTACQVYYIAKKRES